MGIKKLLAKQAQDEVESRAGESNCAETGQREEEEGKVGIEYAAWNIFEMGLDELRRVV